jgi:two-component SAPR family response regulator
MAHIVVLEDERIVRNFVTLVLRQHQHTVRQTSTPEDAEQICKSHSVDLLVADVKLSAGKSGTDFAYRLMQAHSQIKCVFISGLPLEDWAKKDQRNLEHIPEQNYTILAKPLSSVTLSKAIDDLLPKVGSG